MLIMIIIMMIVVMLHDYHATTVQSDWNDCSSL